MSHKYKTQSRKIYGELPSSEDSKEITFLQLEKIKGINPPSSAELKLETPTQIFEPLITLPLLCYGEKFYGLYYFPCPVLNYQVLFSIGQVLLYYCHPNADGE